MTHTALIADRDSAALQRLPSLRVQLVLYGNSTEDIGRTLESIVNSLTQAASQISDWTVVVGDSSPEPVLPERLLTEFDRSCQTAGGSFRYQFFDKNLGHGGGHNRLHEESNQDLLMIVNPDGILAPDTITQLVAALTPGVGVVDARQLPLEHPKEYDPVTGAACWSSLACALTPAELFKRVGGIDHETFFMYCDDVDYSWRVRLAGYAAKYCPQARMFHDKRLDGRGNFLAGETEKYYSAEAALFLAYKYSRDDVLQALQQVMATSGDPYHSRALATFQTRSREGRLPPRLDPDHLVAEFTDGSYGAHRF